MPHYLMGLCRKNEFRTGNPSQSLFLIGQFQKVETPTLLMLAHRLFQRQENCPLRIALSSQVVVHRLLGYQRMALKQHSYPR